MGGGCVTSGSDGKKMKPSHRGPVASNSVTMGSDSMAVATGSTTMATDSVATTIASAAMATHFATTAANCVAMTASSVTMATDCVATTASSVTMTADCGRRGLMSSTDCVALDQNLLEDIHRTGAKCVSGGQQDPLAPGTAYHVTGVLRTKPGRGERTLSMCCSDKLAKWNIVGMQGALLSHFLTNPVYLSTITVGRYVCWALAVKFTLLMVTWSTGPCGHSHLTLGPSPFI